MLPLNSIGWFFHKNWKWIAIIALIVIALLSVKSCNEYKAAANDAAKAAHFNDSLANSKITYYKDENGQLHETVDNLYVTYFQLRDQVDSVSNLLHIKSKQITAISYTGTKIQLDINPKVDTVFKKIPCGDSGDSIYVAAAFDLSWRDKWMKVSGALNGVNDSLHVEGTDTLQRVDYSKRKWFLGAKHYYTDISNSNPHIKVVGYKGAEFKGADKRFNLSLSVMYGYPFQGMDIKKPSFFFGLTTGFSLAKF